VGTGLSPGKVPLATPSTSGDWAWYRCEASYPLAGESGKTHKSSFRPPSLLTATGRTFMWADVAHWPQAFYEGRGYTRGSATRHEDKDGIR